MSACELFDYSFYYLFLITYHTMQQNHMISNQKR